MFQHHPSTRTTPPYSDDAVEIDNAMLGLVQRIWAIGRQTMACCQDAGEAADAERMHGARREPTGHQGFIGYHRGWAWLKMPTADTLSLLTELSGHETFSTRVKVRWQRGSWRVHIPVIYQNGQFTAARYAQIYFPNDQITELTAALAAFAPGKVTACFDPSAHH